MGDYLPTPGHSATNKLEAAKTTIGSYPMCLDAHADAFPGYLPSRI